MNLYQPIDIPINFGKNELSPECAYFLGAIFSADESFVYEGKRFWLAPVRHNSGQNIEVQLQEHMRFLQQIIGRANGRIITRSEMKLRNWYGSDSMARAFRTKQGFAAIFESEEATSIDSFIRDVETAMDRSSTEVIQSFLAGAFDGRSAIDRNTSNNQIRYLALDCENLVAAEYLRTLLSKLQIEFNYNTSRDRLEGGLPRKAQLRIQGNNVSIFMEKVGLVSPLKFEIIRSMLDQSLYVHVDDWVLQGLKTLSSIPQTGVVFEYYAPETQIIEDDLDQKLLNFVSKFDIAGEPHFQYSGRPQEKRILTEATHHQTYPRSKSVAANALAVAGYRCEIDRNHPSFIRRNSDLPYSEPHHLVPVGFHKMFSVSLDVEENIISLCSNCHNQLHYGKEIRMLLTQLYDERKDLLHSVGIDVSLQGLFKMYNA